MRRYLLDTSPLAALLLARPAAVALITPWMEGHEAATSILAYAEVVEYMTCIPHIVIRVCVAMFVKAYHLVTLTFIGDYLGHLWP